MTSVLVSGETSARFEPVRKAFEANFRERGDVGAACSVYLNGRPVVDIWGGVADKATGRAWQASTPAPVFSATKGALATCVQLLIERGALDPDAPVARYWPEFAANGKSEILLSWVLSHRSGVPAVDAHVTLEDIAGWYGVVAAVASQEPSWRPGAAHGYHPRSFGWILGEVVRRVTGMSAGQFIAQEIAVPLGLELWIGLPDAIEPQVAALSAPPPEDLAEIDSGDAADLRSRALSGPSNLFAYDERWNSSPYLRPEMPSSNGVATARALARMFASSFIEVDGIRLLSDATVERARTVEADGNDLILGRRSTFGLGFSLFPSLGTYCPPGSFGNAGAGGSMAFADPESGISFGYVTNQLRLGANETARADALIAALYTAVPERRLRRPRGQALGVRLRS